MIVTNSTFSRRYGRGATVRNGRVALLAIGLTLAAIACDPGDGVNAPPVFDASIDAWERSCWYGGGTPTPGAELTIGLGLATFEPLLADQTLEIIAGPQGGAHLEMHARMSGLSPGDVNDAWGRAPHTLVTIENEAGDRLTALDCTFPQPYVENGDGTYQLVSGRIILIRSNYLGDLNGSRALVRMEAQDPEGRYAIVEQYVNLIDPFDTSSKDAGVAASPGASYF